MDNPAPTPPSPRETLTGNVLEFCGNSWWMFLIGGVASIIFGVLAIMNPGIALLILSVFFAAFLLTDGAVHIWGAIAQRGNDGWILALISGILGVCIGGFLLLAPPVSMVVFIYYVAFIALSIGIMLLALGWKVRKEITTEWILYLNGVLSILFSGLLFFNVGVGGVTIAYMIAFWAILTGALRIVIGLKMKNFVKSRTVTA